MPQRSRKRPDSDENEAAYAAVQRVIELTEPQDDKLRELLVRARAEGKDPLAVALGRRGGLKRGRARKLSKEQLRASALKAARARWDKRKAR